MAGNASPARLAAFAVLLRGQGRDARRTGRAGAHDARAGHAARPPGPGGGCRRHRRRPGPHGQHLHDGLARRRRRPAGGSSSTATGRPPRPAAPPTCSRSSASSSTCRPRASPARWPRSVSGSASPRSSTRACATPARSARDLGVPTAFNFLGPLTNPARVRAAGIGCADPAMAPVMAAVLAERGDSALVFRGDDGLDELTTTTTSRSGSPPGAAVHRDRRRPRCARHSPRTGRGAAGRGPHGQRPRRPGTARRPGRGIRDAVLLNAAAAIAAFDGLADVDAGSLPMRCAAGCGWRPRPWTPVPPPHCSTAGSAPAALRGPELPPLPPRGGYWWRA